MILKESWIFATDNTNINWLKVFHLYQGHHRKKLTTGFFLKGSARVVEPPRLEYKGFKYKYNVKGDICKMLLVRSNFPTHTKNSNVFRLKGNSGFILKKRQEPKSKFLNGPVLRSIKRKKVTTLFPTSI